MTLHQTMRRRVLNRAIVNLRNFYRLKISRKALTIACLVLAGLIGYVDYLTGYEHSMLLFYFLPISYAVFCLKKKKYNARRTVFATHIANRKMLALIAQVLTRYAVSTFT